MTILQTILSLGRWLDQIPRSGKRGFENLAPGFWRIVDGRPVQILYQGVDNASTPKKTETTQASSDQNTSDIQKSTQTPHQQLQLPTSKNVLVSPSQIMKNGKAIVEGCNSGKTTMNDKQHILSLLLGNVTDTTARTSVGISRNTLVDIKKNGIKKTGGVTKKR